MEMTKDAIKAFIKCRDYVTFYELQQAIGDESTGYFAIDAPKNLGKTLLWAGMSKEFAHMIQELGKEKSIVLVPSGAITYFVDGGGLSLPICKRNYRYKKTHWLPVCLRTAEQAAGL